MQILIDNNNNPIFIMYHYIVTLENEKELKHKKHIDLIMSF